MSENYKFFRHKECEYFPCHKVSNDSNFNCLFCYCPLYFIDDCGGNNSYKDGIKDCISCLIPHSKNGYTYIVNKLKEINEMKRKK